MNQLRIYGISASRAIRPLWTACELGINFDHSPQHYRGGATRSAEFLAINPNGHIPVVTEVRDGKSITVWESMACALYLADTYGKADGTDISPASPAEKADALRWVFWVVTEVEKDALSVLMHRLAMPEEERRTEIAEAAEKRLKIPLGILEQHLRHQQEHKQNMLAGTRFTIADLCVASVLSWARAADQAFWDAYPTTQGWLRSCLARPAHKQARALP